MPAPRPTTYLNWIPTNNPSFLQQPSAGQSSTGWIANEMPPFQYMNYIHNLLDRWVQYLDQKVAAAVYDVVIGAEPFATHPTLAAAVADVSVGANQRVLIFDSATLTSTVVLSKAGWRITARPGVTYTDGGAGTGLDITAVGVEIDHLRFDAFTVVAIKFDTGGDYGRVLNCNFTSANANEIDDTNAAAGKKPATIGNFSEI